MLLDPQKDILKHKSMKDLINLIKTIIWHLALIHNVFAISETWSLIAVFVNFQTQPDKSCDVQDCTSELDIS